MAQDQGYPDYSRLSRTGGVLISGGGGPITNFQTLFQGYVGDFAYLNMFTQAGINANSALFGIAYFTDNTFLNELSSHNFARGSNMNSLVQYANFSEWVQIVAETSDGNPYNNVQWDIYGANGYASPTTLTPSNRPFWSVNTVIAAATTVTFNPITVAPGLGILNLFSGATAWNVNFQWYDFASNSYITYYSADQNTFADAGCHIQIPMIDAPMQIQIHNQDAAPRGFTAILGVVLWRTCGLASE